MYPVAVLLLPFFLSLFHPSLASLFFFLFIPIPLLPFFPSSSSPPRSLTPPHLLSLPHLSLVFFLSSFSLPLASFFHSPLSGLPPPTVHLLATPMAPSSTTTVPKRTLPPSPAPSINSSSPHTQDTPPDSHWSSYTDSFGRES